MKNPTSRDVLHAVLIAVFVTAIATAALLDPSCRRPDESGHSRSVAP